jgi:putative transposase
MPWGLKRFQEAGCLHFLTFSCYQRAPLLGTPRARDIFEHTLEKARRWYGFYAAADVVMPEHVRLLVTEPERAKLSMAIQMLKQNVARQIRGGPFWQARYYDLCVWSEKKRIEKLRYIHRNPVRRGLVASPEQWDWSSFRHYLSGVEGVVEIESQWTARKREELGVAPRITGSQIPRPFDRLRAGSVAQNATRTGQPSYSRLERLGQPPCWPLFDGIRGGIRVRRLQPAAILSSSWAYCHVRPNQLNWAASFALQGSWADNASSHP